MLFFLIGIVLLLILIFRGKSRIDKLVVAFFLIWIVSKLMGHH